MFQVVDWSEIVDIVVVGSGFAGLAAAIEARNSGASVLVLEKMKAPGGNSV
ncbi:FAD-dependent oxidoreductase, partial [bacterium]|nr:FAD-dependent oxidoreductase [bacterium]